MPHVSLVLWACREKWQRFGADVAAAEKASMAAEKGFAFAFVEGALVKAVREGCWLLLDEINLAPAEVPACPHLYALPITHHCTYRTLLHLCKLNKFACM